MTKVIPCSVAFHAERRTIGSIMKLTVSLMAALALSAVPSLITAQTNCHDVSEDSHYSVVYENSRVRVLTLELPRLASTGSVCNKSAYLSIVTTESRTLVAPAGIAGVTYNWYPGAARFHYAPVARTIRNETDVAHREVVIETFSKLDYNPVNGNYDGDEFQGDLRSVKATTSSSFTRGGLTAYRVQLAPGDTFSLSDADHLVIALNDISLAGDNGKSIDLGRSDLTVLTLGRINSVKNTNKMSAQFIVVDF
jgi:hypothetical protein